MASHKSLGAFAKSIKGTANKIPDRSDKIVREVALAMDRTLVLNTPVDTGRARANWQASIGSPITTTVDEAPGKRASVAHATNRNAQAIAQYKGGDEIFLTNNLPYIVPLNNGHSSQRPAGFVERAVYGVINAARKARLISGTG